MVDVDVVDACIVLSDVMFATNGHEHTWMIMHKARSMIHSHSSVIVRFAQIDEFSEMCIASSAIRICINRFEKKEYEASKGQFIVRTQLFMQ